MPEQATVLVVDDEIGPRESLRAILKPDYQVLVAAEGEQAVRVIEQEPVDIVLLDLRMPGLSGIQVLEKIKAIDPDIEVILVTGYASYETLLEALHLRAFDYIPKPFNVPHVREMVKRATAQRHSQRRSRHATAESDQQPRSPDAEPTALNKKPESVSTPLFHELRASLQTINSFHHLLQEHYIDQLDARGTDALQRARTAGQRVAQLIDDLFSPLREGQGST
jgi:two-component system sensor histidine kinase/response regulator